jgi:hypothetical protein
MTEQPSTSGSPSLISWLVLILLGVVVVGGLLVLALRSG